MKAQSVVMRAVKENKWKRILLSGLPEVSQILFQIKWAAAGALFPLVSFRSELN